MSVLSIPKRTMNKSLPTLPQHYANHYCNSGPTLGQRNFEDVPTLGQRCANMLGQRWDTLHLQRWPNIESQRWPNKVNNVGPTLGQRMRAVWGGDLFTVEPNIVTSGKASSLVIKYWNYSKSFWGFFIVLGACFVEGRGGDTE